MHPEAQLPVFENYLSIARNYCHYYESALIGDQRQFISQVQGLLLELYSQGRLLPQVNPSGQKFNELLKRSDKQIQGLIAHKLPFSGYWQALDPFSIDKSELGLGDLLDDLGDIYLDLKRAMLLYNSNVEGARQEAYWKLKFDFDIHLADHAMNAMKAIHDYMGKDGYNGW